MFMCLGVCISHAQSRRIEALKESLDEAPPDSHKVDRLNELSWELHRVDLDASLEYARKARTLAEKFSYPKGISRALNLEGIFYILRNQPAEAIQLNRHALSIAENIQDSFLIAVTNNDIAISIMNDYPTALAYLQKALAYCPENQLLVRILFLSNIAELHLNLNNRVHAEAYIREAVDLTRHSKDTTILITVAMIEGAYAQKTGDTTKAKQLYDKAGALARCMNDYYVQANIELNMAGFLLDENKTEASLARLKLAEELMKKSGNAYFLAGCIYQKAEIYEKRKEFSLAEEALKQSLGIAKKVHDLPTQSNCYGLLKKIYEKTYRPVLALAAADSLFALKDSLSNREKNQIFAQNELVFQVAQKDAENELLKKENETNLLKLNNNKLLLKTSVIIIILGVGIILAFWLNYKSKAQQGRLLEKTILEKTSDLKHLNEDLKASNIELEQFARMASHDLKEPIRNIVSFAGLLEKKLERDHPDPELKDHARYIIHSTKHLYTLIEDVMTFTRLGQDHTAPKPVNLVHVAGQAVEAIGDLIEQKSASVEIGPLPAIMGSDTMMFLIFKHLIENGIKYNKSTPPIVKITHHVSDGVLHLDFKDNGIGISPEFHHRIFEMFTRLHSRQEYEGSGIGLATCQKVIRLMNGKIFVKSQLGGGSVFCISLPCETVGCDQISQIHPVAGFGSSMDAALRLNK